MYILYLLILDIYKILNQESEHNPFKEDQYNKIINNSEIIEHINSNSNKDNPNYLLSACFLDAFWIGKIENIPINLPQTLGIKTKKEREVNIKITSEKFDALKETLRGLHSLKSLTLSFSEMNNSNLKDLCDIFQDISNLEELYLIDTSIDNLDCLSNSLSTLKKLKEIIIKSGLIDDIDSSKNTICCRYPAMNIKIDKI